MSELTRGIHDIVINESQEVTGSVGIEEKIILFATGTANVSGDNTLIAAPTAGLQIKLVSIQIQNESVTATTGVLKFGATNKWRTLMQNQGDGILLVIPAGREWGVGDNTALILNLSGANSVGYNVTYYTEPI